MAFVSVETWRAEPLYRAASLPVWVRTILHLAGGSRARRLLSLGGAALLHVLLMIMALKGGVEPAPSLPIAQRQVTGSAMEVVELLPATEQQSAKGGAVQANVPASVSAELDTSRSVTMPVEWSMAPVRVAIKEAILAGATPGSPLGDGTGSGTGASAKPGEYDPYAGASPMRRPASTVSTQTSSPVLDLWELDRLSRAYVARFGAANQVLRIVAEVSSDGVVFSARLESPSTSQATRFLQAIIGKRLFRVVSGQGAGASVKLPPIAI